MTDERSGPRWGGAVEQLVFGTRELAEIDGHLDRFCVTRLGAGIADVLFRETSVGVVTGVRLDDGRRVVVKAHQPRETGERLRAVHELQGALHRAGLPCPRPLAGPVALAHGHLTAETLIDEGEYRDTHDPSCRRLIAEALAEHLRVTGATDAPAALADGFRLLEPGRLWPAEAHSPIFDFAATAAGAEWIDALGACARAAIGPPRRPVAGHSDWSGKHFRFTGGAITAIYDWDSLAVAPEAAIVGVAAMTFTTRFDLPGVSRAPSPPELGAFVDEYSAARERPLDRAARRRVAAHGLLVAAYTARCEHCRVDGTDPEADPDSFTVALRAHGDAYLAV